MWTPQRVLQGLYAHTDRLRLSNRWIPCFSHEIWMRKETRGSLEALTVDLHRWLTWDSCNPVWQTGSAAEVIPGQRTWQNRDTCLCYQVQKYTLTQRQFYGLEKTGNLYFYRESLVKMFSIAGSNVEFTPRLTVWQSDAGTIQSFNGGKVRGAAGDTKPF